MAKYNAYLILQEVIYIDAITGNECNPTSEEKLLQTIFNNEHRYQYYELYSKVGKVSGKTKRELQNNAYSLNVNFDFLYLL